MAFSRLSSLGLLLGSALSIGAAGCGGGIESGDYVLIRVAFADIEENPSCYANGEIPKEIKEDTSTFRSGSTFVLFRGPGETFYLDTDMVVMEGTRKDNLFTFKGESVDVEYANGTPAVTVIDSDHDGIEDSQDSAVDADNDGQDDEFQDDEVDVDGDGEDDRFEDDSVDVNGDGIDDRFTIITPAMDGDKLSTTRNTTMTFTISGFDVDGAVESALRVTCSGATCPTILPDCSQNVDFVGTVVQDADVEHQL